MKSTWLRFAHVLSSTLDPAESETVFGDFAELRMTDRRVFQGMLGLVVRRQLRHWKEWEPWFVLAAIVVPIGPLLATLSIQLSQDLFFDRAIWLHHRISLETGVSSTAHLAEFCFRATALMTWSWISGCALSGFSPRTSWLNGTLFFALCTISGICGIYGDLTPIQFLLAAPWSLMPWVWDIILLKFLVILIPAYGGFRQTSRSPGITYGWLVLLAAWTLVIGGLAFSTAGWYGAALDNWSHGAPALGLFQLMQRADVWETLGSHLFTLTLLTGPILYLLVMRRNSHPLKHISRA